MPIVTSSNPIITRRNHITNGDFATDVSGWSGATISRIIGNNISPGRAQIVTTSNSNCHQQITGLTVGKKYIFSYRHFKGYTSAHVGPNTSSASALLSTGDTWAAEERGVVKTGIFTANATSVYVNIYGIGSNTSVFDDVKLVEDYSHHAGTTSGTSKVAMSGEYPKVAPTAVFDFANSRHLDERWWTTRASSGTYYGPNGYIQTVGNNRPRFTHDPDTLECLGLLTEEGRTNHVTNNAGSGHVSATSGGGSIQTNTGLSPRGLASDSFYYQAGTASGYAGFTINVSGLTNTTSEYFVFSLYVKIESSNYTTMSIYDNSQTGGNGAARFNLSNGTLAYETNANTSAIQKCKDGWYRIKVSGLRPTSPTSSSMLITFWNGSTNSFAADGSSKLYFWGAQYEQNEKWPSMPIRTSGSKVTTTPDRHYIYGQDFQDIYDGSHTNNHGHGTIMYVADKTHDGNWTGAWGTGVDSNNWNLRGPWMMGHSSSYRDSFCNSIADGYALWSGTHNAQNAYAGLQAGRQTFKTASHWNKHHSGMDWDAQLVSATSNRSYVNKAPDAGSGSAHRTMTTHWQVFCAGGNVAWEGPTGSYGTIGLSTLRYLAIWDQETSDDELLSLCSVGSAP